MYIACTPYDFPWILSTGVEACSLVDDILVGDVVVVFKVKASKVSYFTIEGANVESRPAPTYNIPILFKFLDPNVYVSSIPPILHLKKSCSSVLDNDNVWRPKQAIPFPRCGRDYCHTATVVQDPCQEKLELTADIKWSQ